MPIKFSDLARDTKAATLDVGGGDTIAFRFRHGLITPRLMHDFLALDVSRLEQATVDEQEAAMMAISAHLARLVTEWDVLDSDGSMFPLDAARLAADIPLLVQVRMLQTCLAGMSEASAGEAAAPGASANGHASGAGSPPRAISARRRNGTR